MRGTEGPNHDLVEALRLVICQATLPMNIRFELDDTDARQ